VQCPSCGARTNRRARFCDQCGVRLTTPPARASLGVAGAGAGTRTRRTPARPSAAVAPPVDALESGDRRVVTALFADLVDYVRMIAEHDPEEVRARVRTALGRMAEAIERFDGTREKFIGDAVFAVFGWPRAHDDDPVRAALAALSIRAALRAPDDGGEPLEVRIGLATGEVVTGPGGAGAGDLSVTGEAITTAARIQSLARPGEILLDEATVRGGRDRLAVDDRGSVVLRGQSSVVRLFALAGEVGIGSIRTGHVPANGPLVGRTAEMGRLRRALEKTRRTGIGTAVLVSGDSGMGKSRLLAELEPEARRLGYAWTWTENVSYGQGEPYRFARVFAQAIADEHGLDSGAFVRQLLFSGPVDNSTIQRFGGAIAAMAREAAFTGWETESRHIPDDPAETAAILAEVATRYIDRLLATDGPRVVVVDDIHWVDPSSNGIVELMVRAAETNPLVVLVTMRPGVAPAWAEMRHVERLTLRGLELPETARLATIVARAALDAEDAQRIHDRTEGNPLFIGETVRASIEDGSLEYHDGRMTLVEVGAPRLPLTLRAVLGARIDGLDKPARDVLGVAAVVGIAFRAEDLVALLERPIADGTLDRLEEAALVVPAEAGAWRFSHPLVRDAAYAGMLAARRRRLHARFADLLEAAPRPGPAVRVAIHRAAAGDAVRAVPLLIDAAESARSLGAPAEAASFWQMAAELAPEANDAARYRAAADAALATSRLMGSVGIG
jgi:adenylate cyclase